ncbi:MAG: germination protein YpeB [Oscillospiraceae bacterium]|nr:germination protein YpeB [Oscillospiraceae bacterium]
MRKKIRIISFFVALTALFSYSYMAKERQWQDFHNSQERQRFELVLSLNQHAGEIANAADKAALTASPAFFAEQTGIIVENTAASRQLLQGYADGELDHLRRFFAQLGEYYLQAQGNFFREKKLTQNNRTALRQLSNFCTELKNHLELTSMRLLKGEEDTQTSVHSLAELPKIAFGGDERPNTEKTAHISKDEAAKLAAKTLEINAILLRELPDQDEPYPAFCWYYGKSRVKISKERALVSELTQGVRVGEILVSDEDAEKVARKFLENMGYNNMTLTHYVQRDGLGIFDFICDENDLLCYPDSARVSVAMDTGEVSGFDAGAYAANKKQRKTAPKISAEQAQSEISRELRVIEEPRLAIISKNGREFLCWQIRCFSDTSEVKTVSANAEDSLREYIIFVDAKNGMELEVIIVT